MTFQDHWRTGRPMAVRDPISIGISIAAAFTGATGVFVPATILGLSTFNIIGTVAIGGLLAGAQFAVNRLSAATPGTFGDTVGLGVNAPEVRGNTQQSVPAQRIIYGRTRAGGAVFFLNTDKPPYLYLGLLLSARKVNSIKSLQIGDNAITFPTLVNNVGTDPLQIDGQTYVSGGSSRLKVCFREGSPSQPVDALLAAGFPSLDTNFRQRGIATATFRFEYGADEDDFSSMWGRVAVPNPLIDLEGTPVYDPRDPSQRYPSDWRDKADVADAMSTWQYRRSGVDVGRTAALVQADWLGFPSGVAYPPDQIRWDEIAAAANYDEELVGNLDGTFSHRHQIDGVVQLNQKPRDVMEAMLTANRGFIVQSKGRGWVESSKPKEPVLTINDSMLLRGFEFRDDKAKVDTVNTVRTRFTSPDREYQEVDGPTLIDEDALEADGEELAISISLPFTSDYRAAERLAKQYKEEARLPRALTCVIRLKGLGLKAGDVVLVASSIYTRMNGTYKIQTIGFLDDFSGLSLSLVETDEDIPRNWVAANDEVPFTLPAVGAS